MITYTSETIVKTPQAEIAFDSFGDPTHPPLLLVAGLGGQLIAWEESFCQDLAAKMYWVIRYDNRDVGHSSKFDHIPLPDMMAVAGMLLSGSSISFDYSLYDMAADGIGLLDALGIQSAHVLGVSMGGMIAQIMTTCYPQRVRTLTTIMSTTNDPALPLPTAEAISVLLSPAVANEQSYVENSLSASRILAGPGYPIDETKTRLNAARAYHRGYYPAGTTRQLLATLACPSRREALKRVTVPTLVIHGDADPLVPVEAGIDTADHIPNAKLLIIPGMGHGITDKLSPQIVAAVTAHAR